MGKVQRVSFDSVESSLGEGGLEQWSLLSVKWASILDADGDGHLTAADLAGAAKASAKSMLGGAGRPVVDVQRRQGRGLVDNKRQAKGSSIKSGVSTRPRRRRRRGKASDLLHA